MCIRHRLAIKFATEISGGGWVETEAGLRDCSSKIECDERRRLKTLTSFETLVRKLFFIWHYI